MASDDRTPAEIRLDNMISADTGAQHFKGKPIAKQPELFGQGYGGESVRIADLVECAERELLMRQAVYPRRVAHKALTQAKADLEIAKMRIIHDVLFQLDATFSLVPHVAGGWALVFSDPHHRQACTDQCGDESLPPCFRLPGLSSDAPRLVAACEACRFTPHHGAPDGGL